MLTAVCSGLTTCIATKVTADQHQGSGQWLARCTAPTVSPVATANTAGSAPPSSSSTHQATARTGIGLRQDGEEPPLRPGPQRSTSHSATTHRLPCLEKTLAGR